MSILQNIGQIVKSANFYTFLAVAICSCGHPASIKTSLQQAEHLLWENPDSCKQILDNIDASQLHEQTYKQWQLLQAHLGLRRQDTICPPDSVVAWAEYFGQQRDLRRAGEAYYVAGSIYYLMNQNISATSLLKQAEWNLTQEKNADPNLLGIIYYRLGNAAAKERTFEVANTYFEKSIPLLKQSQNHLFLCCAYRDAAISMQDKQIQLALQYLDTALYYSRTDSLYVLQKEIECQIEDTRNPNSFSSNQLSLYRFLCDTIGISSRSEKLIAYYLSIHQPDSAYQYLEILKTDTSNHIWSKEHYLYHLSSYLSMTQQKDSAIAVLKKLHNWQTEEIENTALARTYTIAQQYDLAKEEEKNMQLRINRMRWIIFLLILLLATMLLAASGFAIYRISKIRYERELSRQKNLYSQLKWNDTEKEKLLQTKILGFLRRAKDDSIKNQLQPNLSSKQLEQLRSDFNLTHNHTIDQLTNEYPLLTETDINLMICIALGLDNADCSIVLNKSKETLYRRRQRLKHHLQLPQDTDLDEWIKQNLYC